MGEKKGLHIDIKPIAYVVGLFVLCFIVFSQHVQYWWAWLLLFFAAYEIQMQCIVKVIKHRLKMINDEIAKLTKQRESLHEAMDKQQEDSSEASLEETLQGTESPDQTESQNNWRKYYYLIFSITILCASMAAIAFVHPAFYQEGYLWTPSDTWLFIIVFMSWFLLFMTDGVLLIKSMKK